MLRTDSSRGDLRLLHDLAVLERVMNAKRPSAWERLERKLGADQAQTVYALLTAPVARAA
jgi:hypothetical protein